MYKSLNLVFIFLFITLPVKAQYAWYNELQDVKGSSAAGMCMDSDENLFVAFNFTDDLKIGGTAYKDGGAILEKLDTEGKHIWHRRFKTISGAYPPYSLNVKNDAAGNVYLLGEYNSDLNLGSQTLHGHDRNGFIAKFSAQGDLRWAKSYMDIQNVWDLDVNDAGDVLVYANSYAPVILDNETLTMVGNAFAVLYTTDGTELWSKVIGSASLYNSWPVSAALDNNRNVYLTGECIGELTLDAHTVMPIGNRDLFLTRLTSDGTCAWLQLINRTIDINLINAGEHGDMIVDASGDVYLANAFWLDMKWGPYHFTDLSVYHHNVFISRIGADGTLKWSKPYYSHEGGGIVFPGNILMHKNNVYVSGVDSYRRFVVSLKSESGERIDSMAMPVENTYMGGGFIMDSESAVYMSGYRLVQGGIAKNYVFKYGDIYAIGEGNISGPEKVCINTNQVVIFTDPIVHATAYEWSVIVNTETHIITTIDPKVSISLSDLSITGNFSVRVRGTNDTRYGPFDNLSIQVETPLEDLNVTADCQKVSFLGDETFKWYFEDKAYPAKNKIIKPSKPGAYYITSQNLCGVYKSNEVLFTPVDEHTVLIPNIITPDTGDDLNQHFVIDEKLGESRLSISNRWGKEIFFSKDYHNDWDAPNSDQGVYFYIISGYCIDEPIKGTLMVKR